MRMREWARLNLVCPASAVEEKRNWRKVEMVSVGEPRDDWNAIDPVRDVKFLVECIRKVEKRLVEFPRPPPQEGLNPELVAKVLPDEITEMINGRISTRIPMLYNILRTYASNYDNDTANAYDNFSKIRRYLVMNILYNGLKPREVDTGPVALITAHLHEILLKFIRRTLDGEFVKSTMCQSYPICFLAIEILCFFMHPMSNAFTTFVEMFFRDIPGAPEEMVQVMKKRPWYEAQAAVRLFGFASSHPTCCLWLIQHPAILSALLRQSHHAEVAVEKWIDEEKMMIIHHFAQCLWQACIKREYSVRAIRALSTYASSMAVLAFSNVAHQFSANAEEYMVFRKAVYESELLQNFHAIAKQVTRWLTPCRFLSDLIRGVGRCLEMDKTLHFLFVQDFAFFESNGISADWDTLKLYCHMTYHICHFTFILHLALTNKSLFGAHWATYIVLYTLENCTDDLFNTIIETHGYELLDLGHLLNMKEPCEAVVQDTVMEALLRYAGFSHKMSGKADGFVGEPRPVEKIPEFCVEAALFCKRAELEDRMSFKEKQLRVKLADTKKEEGNSLFKKCQFRAAIEMYTEALAICPLSARVKQSVYYSNRAECYLRLNDPQRTVHDCNRSLCLDYSMFIKIQWRRSRAYQKLDMDYPAWLDMYCIRDEWKKDKVENFDELEDRLRDKLCYVEPADNVDLERKAVDQF